LDFPDETAGFHFQTIAHAAAEIPRKYAMASSCKNTPSPNGGHGTTPTTLFLKNGCRA
jgi:hypothetical protein